MNTIRWPMMAERDSLDACLEDRQGRRFLSDALDALRAEPAASSTA